MAHIETDGESTTIGTRSKFTWPIVIVIVSAIWGSATFYSSIKNKAEAAITKQDAQIMLQSYVTQDEWKAQIKSRDEQLARIENNQEKMNDRIIKIMIKLGIDDKYKENISLSNVSKEYIHYISGISPKFDSTPTKIQK